MLYCGVSDYDIVVLGDHTASIFEIKIEELCSSFTFVAINKLQVIITQTTTMWILPALETSNILSPEVVKVRCSHMKIIY
jgi:hypothetical protein